MNSVSGSLENPPSNSKVLRVSVVLKHCVELRIVRGLYVEDDLKATAFESREFNLGFDNLGTGANGKKT